MEENKFLHIDYTLCSSLDDEEFQLTEQTEAGRPFTLITGLGMALDAFESQVRDLQKGDHFDFTLMPGEAFGDYHDDYVQEFPRSVFEIDGKFDDEHIRPDATIYMTGENGAHIPALVSEINDSNVVLDFNHPLAGCRLHFVGTVLESRAATKEELAKAVKMMSGEGCGCGCDDCDHEHHHHDGEGHHCGCDCCGD